MGGYKSFLGLGLAATLSITALIALTYGSIHGTEIKIHWVDPGQSGRFGSTSFAAQQRSVRQG